MNFRRFQNDKLVASIRLKKSWLYNCDYVISALSQLLHYVMHGNVFIIGKLITAEITLFTKIIYIIIIQYNYYGLSILILSKSYYKI